MKKRTIKQILTGLLFWQNPNTPVNEKIKWAEGEIRDMRKLVFEKKEPTYKGGTMLQDYAGLFKNSVAYHLDKTERKRRKHEDLDRRRARSLKGRLFAEEGE